MTKPKVLLTSAIDPAVSPSLAGACDVVLAPDVTPATLNRLAADVDGIIVRNLLPRDVFDHATRVRFVVRHGVGLDMIPMTAATAAGVIVANLPGSNTTAVVEYCLAAMLQLRRNLAGIDSTLRADGWGKARPMADRGRELRASTLGIVGVGAIGTELARIASTMGMRVLGLTRRPAALPPFVEPADRAQLFASADVVVLSCPLTDETRGLVSRDVIATMKSGAILINVSRGPVVDTAALLESLRAGRLGGAALDVHDVQPLTPDAAVFDAPDLLLTPHVAGVTATSLHAMSRGAVDTMLALLRGERPLNIVNPEVLTAPRTILDD